MIEPRPPAGEVTASFLSSLATILVDRLVLQKVIHAIFEIQYVSLVRDLRDIRCRLRNEHDMVAVRKYCGCLV